MIPRSAGRAVSGARGRNVVRLAVGCVTITCLAQTLAPAVPAQASETGSVPDQPSFIVVVTDDQRWDSLWAMPFVNEDLRARAVDFTNAFVTTPTCCPSRASFLSGGFYAHNTGVLTNNGPNGGVTKFDDTRSMPLKLQRAGYRTALIGKYLNGYNALAPYIPPGWTRFVGNTFTGDWLASRVVIGSSGRASSRGSEMTVDGHLVEFQFDEAIRFLKDNEGLPFFLLLSLAAPHKPATPETNNTTLFQNFQYRGSGYGEFNLSDKAQIIKKLAAAFPEDPTEADALHRDQLRTLRDVDRRMHELYEWVADRGQEDSVIWVYTSDNGYQWGEHRLQGKALPYDESIRVPLMVAVPGVRPRTDPSLIAANLDVATTIFDYARIYTTPRKLRRHSDGATLRSLLENRKNAAWRTDLPVQRWGGMGFAALLTQETFGTPGFTDEDAWTWKYIEFHTGAIEAYRSVTDPFELRSKHEATFFQYRGGATTERAPCASSRGSP